MITLEDSGIGMMDGLNMCEGVVDSEDLPLNFSRKTLQQNTTVRAIKKNLVKKCWGMLAEIAEKKENFYEQFGKCMKLGVLEDLMTLTKIAEVLRRHEQISLNEYVDRMKEGQNDVSYITGESSVEVSF